MKNHKKKYFYATTLVFMAVFLFGGLVSADYFSDGRKNSAKPLAFYHSSVASAGYTSHYDAGRAYWNGNSKVNIAKAVTNSVTDRPDIYYIGDSAVSGLLGQMTPYTSSGAVTSPDNYWDYTTVYMYDNNMRAMGTNYTAAHVKFNAAHEIGHTLKMAHPASAFDSVMPQGWRVIPSSITTYDSGQINSKWPL